jgi:hypothetical protein
MAILKHIQFTCLIKANGRLKEFNFRKKSGLPELVYEVDVSDEKGNRHYFSMQLNGKKWSITEKDVAKWIQEVTAEVQTAIEEHDH